MRLNDIPAATTLDGSETVLGLRAGAATLLPTAKIAAAAQRRLLLVGNRAQMLDTVAGGGGSNNSGANYTRGESFYVVKNGPVGLRNLRLVFGNYALGPYENATAAPNAITVEAAISPALSSSVGQVARVTFGGRTTVTLDPDGEVESDAVGVYIPPNASFIVRTGVMVAAGQTWPTGYLNSVTAGQPYDNAVASTAATSQVMTTNASLSTPSGGASGQQGYGPVAILGEADGAMLSIALLGDSLTIGNTGAALGDGQGNRGVLGYGLAAVNGAQLAYNRLARASEAALDLTYLDRSKHRFRLANYATHVVVWLGTNDVPNASTTAQIESYLASIYAQLRGRAQRIIAVTLPPRTTSTDAFATTANQTPMTGYEVGGKRDQVNAWIKAQAGGLVDEVIDLNTAFESPTTPGAWVPGLTADGTHPNEAGMQAGKGKVSAAAARWTAA